MVTLVAKKLSCPSLTCHPLQPSEKKKKGRSSSPAFKDNPLIKYHQGGKARF